MSQRNVLIALRMAGVGGRGKLNGILRYLETHQFSWNIQLIRTALELTPDIITDALRRKTDGFIVSLPGSDKAVKPLLNANAPLVLLDTRVTEVPKSRANLAVIKNDGALIGQAAAEHFLSQGAYASYGYVMNGSTEWARERLAAYEATLKRHDFACQTFDTPLNGTYVPNRNTVIDWLKKLPKPAAVFVDCDDHAHSVLDICRDADIAVPREVAVLGVGNDNVICMHSTPSLSSILPDFDGEGYLAAQLLSGMMQRPSAKAIPRFFKRGVADTVVRESSSPMTPAGHLVVRGMRFIEENALKDIGVDDVVRHLNVSRSLAILRFREVRGESIFAAIRRTRLKAVANLLETTRIPISEVAERCGFTNSNHLKNIFKAQFGRTMREYRNSIS